MAHTLPSGGEVESGLDDGGLGGYGLGGSGLIGGGGLGGGNGKFDGGGGADKTGRIPTARITGIQCGGQATPPKEGWSAST